MEADIVSRVDKLEAELQRLKYLIKAKTLHEYVIEELHRVEAVEIKERLKIEKEWAKNVYWMYSILIEDEFAMSRDELMKELEKKGIETRTFFVPMHEQPVFQNMGLFKGESYPVAEELSRKGMYLPSSSGLKEEEIKYICDAIKKITERI